MQQRKCFTFSDFMLKLCTSLECTIHGHSWATNRLDFEGHEFRTRGRRRLSKMHF